MVLQIELHILIVFEVKRLFEIGPRKFGEKVSQFKVALFDVDRFCCWVFRTVPFIVVKRYLLSPTTKLPPPPKQPSMFNNMSLITLKTPIIVSICGRVVWCPLSNIPRLAFISAPSFSVSRVSLCFVRFPSSSM